MKVRIIFSLLVISLCFSCEFLEKLNESGFSTTKMDTVIDYTRVDVLPSFKICDSLLEIPDKNRCFVNNLYNHFSKELLAHTFNLPESVYERVIVHIRINAKGNATLVSIDSSELIKNTIPTLDQIIKDSIDKLPMLYPALKRGIPVATVYELPIVINLK